MGKGIELARVEAPEHAAVMEEFRDQLLIAFLRRLGGQVEIPVSEVDETGGFLLAMSLTDVYTRSGTVKTFNFELRKKS
jgi:hypothetical protein